jgi:hypothetical protein
MTVNANQIQSIQRTWRQVCKDRGWQPNDRAFRLTTFSELLGRPLDSLTHVERIAECTRLMNGLKAMLGVSVRAGIEAGDTTINDARVLRYHIATEIIPCLELYLADAAAYVTEIMADKNRWWKIDRPVRDITLDDLDAKPTWRNGRPGPSQLQQLQWTLSARLNELRKSARHTIHDMRIAAKLSCTCSRCNRASLPGIAANGNTPCPGVAIPDFRPETVKEPECPF